MALKPVGIVKFVPFDTEDVIYTLMYLIQQDARRAQSRVPVIFPKRAVEAYVNKIVEICMREHYILPSFRMLKFEDKQFVMPLEKFCVHLVHQNPYEELVDLYLFNKHVPNEILQNTYKPLKFLDELKLKADPLLFKLGLERRNSTDTYKNYIMQVCQSDAAMNAFYLNKELSLHETNHLAVLVGYTLQEQTKEQGAPQLTSDDYAQMYGIVQNARNRKNNPNDPGSGLF